MLRNLIKNSGWTGVLLIVALVIFNIVAVLFFVALLTDPHHQVEIRYKRGFGAFTVAVTVMMNTLLIHSLFFAPRRLKKSDEN
ncbi:MAG: hypothetical protein A3C06_03595 [Candidatus Taylorbacteria bacterium RIFCSPHIGHO2_02_FULL_46_13]|uniref:Uncharacterized protein n=1 Tax=Candidatus Taylorbacteria bacterium RIFCSPHIGHO2_02_FULL_46_13 TaxID=1802312 RepID=A0A1G2MT54_9BACT|nr:MAG: hypothetical protein A3C06_03595 [Candidatus Taylorbacteria bacterium RIFCSPHIGHO2_02_FULL_46_13]